MSLEISGETTFLLDMVNESYPSILDDGNTEGWYDMDESYMTKDGGNAVSAWADRSGNGNNLAATNGPIWSSNGVLFDGVDQYARVQIVGLEQPTQIYAVLKQVTWTAGKTLLDGYGAGDLGSLNQIVGTPDLYLDAGTLAVGSSALAVDTWGIVRILFNGASSQLIIDDNTPETGDPGSTDMDGITLGAQGNISSWGNVQVKEVIIRSVADGASDEAVIYAYLKNKYSL